MALIIPTSSPNRTPRCTTRRDRTPDSYAETFDGKPQVHENYLAYRGVEGFDWKLWAEALAKYWGS